ncbi:MAG TPA: DctP family TRAP transporter solute-binding subunit [Beijerinckiaceae bacterium]|nr:DctP family TRAP transporter solute-binding subunit [Beijerinckiaceae bacterium]
MISRLLAGAILAACFVPHAQAQVELRLGHVLAESHSWHVAATGFAKDVADKTGGRVKITVFPSSQLGSEKDMVEGLQIGSQQAGLIGSGSFQPIEPKMGIVELPYAWPTREHAYRAFDGELGGALAKLLEARGIVTLAWWENGFRHITTRGEPVRAPADLKGLKIRVTPDKMRLDTFRALGAEPAPLAFGELYSALQQGVFDAQENPLAIIWSASFFEVQKSVSLTGHVWGAACLVVSRQAWNRISAADQEVIRAAARDWGTKQRQMIAESEGDLAKKLEGKGMRVVEVEKAPFVTAVQPVWKEFGAQFGPELMGLLDKYRK